MPLTGMTCEADALRRSGRLSDAERAYRLDLQSSANDPLLLYGLGLTLKGQGRPQEALAAFARASEQANCPVEALIEAGVTSALVGQHDDALRRIVMATVRYPDRPEPFFLLGRMLASRHRHEEAIAQYERALAVNPKDLEAISGLIFSLRKLNRFKEAEAAAVNWLKLAPTDPAAPATLAHIYLEMGLPDLALPHARKTLALNPMSVDAAILLARLHLIVGEPAEAVKELDRARKFAPNNPALLVHLGHALKVVGQFDAARATLRDAQWLDPANASILFELSDITRFSPGDALIGEIERASSSANNAPDAARKLHFALGKAYDELGRTEEAFTHFELGNALEQARGSYDEVATLSVFETIKSIFTDQFINERRGYGLPSDLPIFIVGMPRSGSTLIEQILASHPRIAAAGEVNYLVHSLNAVRPAPSFPANLSDLSGKDISRVAEIYLPNLASHSCGKSKVTDKLLANAMLVGLIHLTFPNARIIHALRDPVDTCLSCYMKSFERRLPYTTNLETVGRYYRMHASLMSHWSRVLPQNSMLEIQYEDVVENLETEAKRLIEYCGLDWDDRCLAFHQTVRPVNTASVAQVREPLYRASVQRWQRYKSHLDPLLSALGVFAT